MSPVRPRNPTAAGGDVATVLSSVRTITVAGVGAWGSALPVLRALGARRVLLAFDGDAHRNHQAVARALYARDLAPRRKVACRPISGMHPRANRGRPRRAASRRLPAAVAAVAAPGANTRAARAPHSSVTHQRPAASDAESPGRSQHGGSGRSAAQRSARCSLRAGRTAHGMGRA